jgi:hypothetical protein
MQNFITIGLVVYERIEDKHTKKQKQIEEEDKTFCIARTQVFIL